MRKAILEAFGMEERALTVQIGQLNKDEQLQASLAPGTDFKRIDLSDIRFKESFLVQALGTSRRKKCTRCERNLAGCIWVQCRTTPLLFGGCCGNCKRLEKATECKFSDVYKDLHKEADKIKWDQYMHRDPAKKVTKRGRTTKAPAFYTK